MSNTALTEFAELRPMQKKPPQPTAPQVSGLCFPAEAASDIDSYFAISVHDRRVRMLQGFAGQARQCNLGEPLRTFLQGIESAPAPEVFALFDSAVPAHLFAWKPPQIVDDMPYEPSFVDRMRWLFAAAAENSGAPVLISPSLGDSGFQHLFFARHALTVDAGRGPVAIICANGGANGGRRMIRSDGMAFTLPAKRVASGIYADGGVQSYPWVCGVPVLNGLPDFTRFSPPQATHQSLNRDLAALADGFQLLATVWPAASAFAERWMRAIVVLAYEGCSRSHTSVHAPQTLMCSAESPVKVAEAICHEFSHARMYLYMERNAIIHNDWSKIHHSPWRRDPRPLIGLINGVHAFLNVCEFYGRLASFDAKWAQEADRVNAAQRTKIETAWHYARQKAEWTPAGERAAMDFDRAVQTLCS